VLPVLNAEVDIVTAAAASIEHWRVAAWFVLSRTPTVNWTEPGCSGVPEITPEFGSKTRPGGRLPAETLQVYGGEPPDASTGESNTKPTSLLVPEQLVTLSPDTTFMESARCTPAPLLSVTLTVKLKEPTGTATPEIAPAGLSVSPVGRFPEAIDQT
jgi:hypothetical protein